MKKILILCLILFSFCLVGCSNNEVFKTEYSMNELASIDDIKLKLINASRNENNQLELVFEIENNTKRTITILPDESFKLYDINKVQIPNTYSNNSNIIKKNKKTTITLNYSVEDKKLYEIYFYSGIVENNIKFTITDTDITK